MRASLNRSLPGLLLLLLAALAVFSLSTRALGQPVAESRGTIDNRAAAAAAETGVAGAPISEAPKGGLLDPDLGTSLFTILVFVLLLVILGATAWKPLLKGLKSREAAIRDSVEAAKRAREDADRAARELEARMAEAQRQASLQLAQAKADAAKVADGIRIQAEAEATALKDRTLREIDAAKQQALTEINNHAAELGTSVARKILQRDVTADDQQRLVEQSLSEMAAKN